MKTHYIEFIEDGPRYGVKMGVYYQIEIDYGAINTPGGVDWDILEVIPLELYCPEIPMEWIIQRGYFDIVENWCWNFVEKQDLWTSFGEELVENALYSD